MNINKLTVAVLVVSAVTLGCSPKSDTNQPASAPTEAAPSSAPPAHLTQADIRVLAPAPAASGQMAFYHKVGEDSVGAITPMAGSEPFTALIRKGDHDVTPMQEGCKYTIEVEVKDATNPSAAPVVVKLPANEQNSVMLPGGEMAERRVTAHMASDAKDNYSCNLMLRQKL